MLPAEDFRQEMFGGLKRMKKYQTIALIFLIAGTSLSLRIAAQVTCGGPAGFCGPAAMNIVNATPMTAPAANAPFRDPDFGALMVRVSNTSTMNGQGIVTDSSSEANEMGLENSALGSHGGHYFAIYSTGGWTIPGWIDDATMNITLLPTMSALGTVSFSFTNPNLFFSSSQTKLLSYNLATKTQTTLFDFATCPNNPTTTLGYYGSISQSGDDSVFAYYYGGAAQGATTTAYAYNAATGACYWYDVTTGMVGGTGMASAAASVGATNLNIHNARISLDGQWLRVDAQQNDNAYFWKIGTTTVVMNNVSGHQCLGYVWMAFDPNNNDEAQLMGSPIANLPLESIWNATSFVSPLPTPAAFTDSHWSWNDASANAMMPICGSIDGDSATYLRAYSGEIICASTDGSHVTWRFAHHRATGRAFWQTPRGNVSPDGKFFIFTSDWDGQLGSREDVFIVNLSNIQFAARNPSITFY